MARKRERSSQTQQSILVLRNEGYSMWEIAKKLKCNGVNGKMVNGLHLDSAFIQSAIQLMPLIHPFTHTFTHQRRLAAMQGTNQLVRSNWGLGILTLRHAQGGIETVILRLPVCTTPIREQHKWALTRIEREVGGSGAQLRKRTSTLESLVWEIDASQVLNWQLH